MSAIIAERSLVVVSEPTWSEWINEKYRAWRAERIGHAAGVTEFGRQFGAPHQVILGWLAEGSQPPRSLKYINRLIDVYGEDEVLPVLGVEKLPRASALDQRTKRIVELIDQVPEERQADLIMLIEDMLRLAGYKRSK